MTCADYRVYQPQPPVIDTIATVLPPGFNPDTRRMQHVTLPEPNSDYLPAYDDTIYMPGGPMMASAPSTAEGLPTYDEATLAPAGILASLAFLSLTSHDSCIVVLQVQDRPCPRLTAGTLLCKPPRSDVNPEAKQTDIVFHPL
jgi:hypothetical protein